jgi:hypothetical protein
MVVLLLLHHQLKVVHQVLGHGVQEHSWVWSHFQRPEKDATSALCQLCNKHVCFTKARSTGMLESINNQ